MRARARFGGVGRPRKAGRTGRRDEIAEVAPVCALVEEAISARVDGEESPLAAIEVERHLASCFACRQFEDVARRLSAETANAVVAAPPPDAVVAKVAAAVPVSATAAVISRLSSSRHRLLASAKAPWAVPAMAVGVALPALALSVLAQHTGYTQGPGHCSFLLSYHHLLQ